MKTTAWKQIQNFLNDEEGATAVEYGVLVALIIALCVGAIAGIGGTISTKFGEVDTSIATAAATDPT
jgi:pilus assembly protein Flp/PilA